MVCKVNHPLTNISPPLTHVLVRCFLCDLQLIRPPHIHHLFHLVSLPSQASDHTGQSWLTCFGESGETLFGGLKAPELKRLEIEEPKAYEKITQVQLGGACGWCAGMLCHCI